MTSCGLAAMMECGNLNGGESPPIKGRASHNTAGEEATVDSAIGPVEQAIGTSRQATQAREQDVRSGLQGLETASHPFPRPLANLKSI